MRIRQSHPIKDRCKLICLLLMLLIVVGSLAKMVHNNRLHEKTSTIEVLLKTALEPVGTTMYIWGGGWNETDNASGGTSTQLGVSENWKVFMENQDEHYDFEKHRYERENGLDCSGFVGWVLYNTFEQASGLKGYVTTSTDMAESLAKREWGRLIKNPREFLPGDIVSMEGHVWICLGTCEDGSVLLVHSSPPGVSVCGTPSKQTNSSANASKATESVATQLAMEYMKKQHPKWQEKYPNREVELSYLENVVVFRWSKSLMLDAEKMQEKSAEEMMRILSPDM